MDNLMIPKDYKSALNLHDTQIGIKTVKDFFRYCWRKSCICCACPHRCSSIRPPASTIT